MSLLLYCISPHAASILQQPRCVLDDNRRLIMRVKNENVKYMLKYFCTLIGFCKYFSLFTHLIYYSLFFCIFFSSFIITSHKRPPTLALCCDPDNTHLQLHLQRHSSISELNFKSEPDATTSLCSIRSHPRKCVMLASNQVSP